MASRYFVRPFYLLIFLFISLYKFHHLRYNFTHLQTENNRQGYSTPPLDVRQRALVYIQGYTNNNNNKPPNIFFLLLLSLQLKLMSLRINVEILSKFLSFLSSSNIAEATHILIYDIRYTPMERKTKTTFDKKKIITLQFLAYEPKGGRKI